MRVTPEGARLLTGAAVLLAVVAMGFFGLAAEAEGSGQLAWFAAGASAFASLLCAVLAWLAQRGVRMDL